MELKGADKRLLRQMGHHLRSTVQVGKEAVSEALLRAIDEAHESAELIKVKVLDTCPLHRKEVARELEERSESHLVQVLGRTILLFRRHPEKPKIDLPSYPLPKPPNG